MTIEELALLGEILICKNMLRASRKLLFLRGEKMILREILLLSNNNKPTQFKTVYHHNCIINVKTRKSHSWTKNHFKQIQLPK